MSLCRRFRTACHAVLSLVRLVAPGQGYIHSQRLPQRSARSFQYGKRRQFLTAALGFGLAFSPVAHSQLVGPIPNTPAFSEPLARAQTTKKPPHHALKAYSRVPEYFERNDGQYDRTVRFAVVNGARALYLTPDEATLVLPSGFDASRAVGSKRNKEVVQSRAAGILRMTLVRANAHAKIEGEGRLAGVSNYLIGADHSKWRRNVPHFSSVKYRDVYPGIDQIYKDKNGEIEVDWIVAPGANPKKIGQVFGGASRLRLADNGDLLIQVGTATVREHKPRIYQRSNGNVVRINGHYVLRGNHEVGIDVGRYDVSKALVIDPVISYATYLGGSAGSNTASAVSLDPQGNTYLTGSTTALDFPGTHSSFVPVFVGMPAVYVTKIDANGALVFTTFFGGSDQNDGNAIAVDASSSIYVAGTTRATNFPVTQGAFQSTKPGGNWIDSAFVAKLSADGSALVYATYLGGSRYVASSTNGVEGNGIAVDAQGNAYVVGTAQTSDFPTTPGAYQTQKGSSGDTLGNVFVSKLNSTGTALVYSIFLGGSGTFSGGTGDDEGAGTVVDAIGNAYVTGTARSSNFPTTPGSYQTTRGGWADAFVAILDPAGATLRYSTLLGGSQSLSTNGGAQPNTDIGVDEGKALTVDSSGNIYVVGLTNASDFPTVNPFQPSLASLDVLMTQGSQTYRASNAFVAKINPTLSGSGALVYATYLGGDGCTGLGTMSCSANYQALQQDVAHAVAVDGSGNAYVAGTTWSWTFPLRYGLGASVQGNQQNAYLAEFDGAGQLQYSAIIATNSDARGVAVDTAARATVVGSTSNAGFPVTGNALQPTLGNPSRGINAYVARVDSVAPLSLSISANPNPSKLNDWVTLTINAIGGKQPNGGNVQWCNGSSCYSAGTLTSSGQIVIGVNWLTLGTDSLVATYAGDANNPPTTSPVYIETVNPGSYAAITAPVNGSAFNAPAAFTLTAQASCATAQGYITTLQFFDNGTLLQSADVGASASQSVTYSLQLTGVAVGTHSYSVTATTSSGAQIASLAVSVGVNPVATPPTVSVTAPADGANFTSPASFGLATSASSSSGLITKLDFFDAGALFNTYVLPTPAASINYTLSLSSVAVGVHAYTVTATDNAGASASSSAVHVTVNPAPSAPTVSITTPLDGASFTAPASFDVTANAASASGLISRVDFYDGSSLLNSYVLPTPTPSINYTLSLTSVAAGTHTYTVTATDNSGTIATSNAVHVIVSATASSPSVSVVTPSNNAFYLAPAAIVVRANASSPNGSVAKVEFFQNGASLGVATSAPYSLTWNNVAAGSYTLTAQVTDSAGNTATSNAVAVSVGNSPSVTVTNVPAGTTVTDGAITVTGSVQAPPNSSVSANDVVGSIMPDGRFVIDNVPLTPGANSVTVTVSTPDGQNATQTLSVTQNGQPSFIFRASPTEGLAPLTVDLSLINEGGATFDHADVYCQDPGTLSLSVPASKLANDSLLGSCTYNANGAAYEVTARVNVVDKNQAVIFSGTQTIQVGSLGDTDLLLQGIYLGMLDQLKAGDVNGALNAITGTMRDKYSAIFAALGSDPTLSVDLDGLKNIQDGNISANYAEYLIVRTVNGVPTGYLIYFIRGEDGIWRIDGM